MIKILRLFYKLFMLALSVGIFLLINGLEFTFFFSCSYPLIYRSLQGDEYYYDNFIDFMKSKNVKHV